MGANHSHHHDVAGKKIGWTILLNAAITLAEVIGGLLTGYLALLADAVHNLSDVAAMILAWAGAKGSMKPATKRSTYGFKRVEVMTALISAFSLIAIAIFVLVEAWDRYRHPVQLEQPWLFIGVACIGLLGNMFSMLVLRSEKDKSLNMKSAFFHMYYDMLSSVFVISGGIVIMYTGWVVIDPILSAIIAVMILRSSYMVIHDATLIFLEAVPPGIEFDKVFEAIKAVPRVQDVHDLHIWSLSSNEVALSCHVCLDEADFASGPDIIVEINEMLRRKFHIGHGTIQLEKRDCARSHLLCQHSDHFWE